MPTPEKPIAPEPARGAASLVGTTLVGRYKVERLLGEGGMGAVYLVHHTGIHKRMALKVLRADLMRNPAVVARFEREAMAAAHFDHPNVAAAHDYGRIDEGSFFLVLEYVEGEELRAALEQAKGPLPLARALYIGRQLASALVRAHELGIVHRDLKPENVMLVKRDGHGDFVKVLDFGLAQVSRRINDEDASEGATPQPARAPTKLTKRGDIFGTPAYMAPEQSVGEDTDVRTDLYAVGIILYELITGQRPFRGKSLLVLVQEHLSAPPPPMSEREPAIKVPKAVEDLVQRLLAKSPEDRIQHPQELLQAIDQIVIDHKLAWPPGANSLTAGSARKSAFSSPLPAAAEKFRSSLLRVGPALHSRLAALSANTKVQGLLARLREPLPTPMQRVPRWLAMVVVALLVALPLGLGVRWLRVPKPQTSVSRATAAAPAAVHAQPAAALASQRALDTAVAQGPVALEALDHRFPEDSRIGRAQVRNQISQRHLVEAMRTIAKLALADPNVGRDPEIAQALVTALQGDNESAKAATQLLERDLGAAGVELLYDLTLKQTGASWKPRLNQSLTKPQVLAKATPELRVALELRTAKRCEAKRQLLPRAQSQGDGRALSQLRSLTQTRGCGFLGLKDCWACLRKGPALAQAIASLEARTQQLESSGGKPDKAGP